MKCCKNGCYTPSTWSKGNAISACDSHKKELQKKLEEWHIHSKCDKCEIKLHIDKLCNEEEDHRYLCISCHPTLLKELLAQ